MPMTSERPVWGNNCRKSSILSAERFSTRVIKRANARVSPLKKSSRRPLSIITLRRAMNYAKYVKLVRVIGRNSRLIPSFQYLSRNHEPLDFACPFANRAKFNVSVELFGRIFLGVAVATVDLNALIGDPHREFTGEKLCH